MPTNARPMRVGVQLPEVERDVRWPEYARIAHAAEEVGFDSLWVGDHLLYRGDGRPERGPWEAWTLLAALAGMTSRVRLGPLVSCLAFHPPAVIAKMAATVDEISGGRLVFGVGAGWNEEEFRAFGLPFDRRVDRFSDAFTIVRQLNAGERVSHCGRFASADDAILLPAPSRRIPLMIGSMGPRMLALTLPHVDAWNCWFDWYGNTPEGFAALNGRVTQIAAEQGRTPTEVARTACVLVVLDERGNERRISEGVTPLHGTTAEIANRLRKFAAAGADEVILVLDPITEGSVRSLADVVQRLHES